MHPIHDLAGRSPKSPKSPENEKNKKYDRQIRFDEKTTYKNPLININLISDCGVIMDNWP